MNQENDKLWKQWLDLKKTIEGIDPTRHIEPEVERGLERFQWALGALLDKAANLES